MTTTTNETKQQRDISCKIDGNILTIAFRNGKQIIVDRAAMADEINTIATMHGYKQKIVDGAAMGQGATIEEKFEACEEIYNRLLDGEWNKRRESGEPRGGLLFTALCRAYPQRTPEQIREWLNGKSRKDQNAMMENSRIRPHIDAIRAEMAKNVATDDLLDELDELE